MERLSAPTLAKLLLAVAGLAVFGWGIRTDDPQRRWWGIALVGAAAALRLWKPRRAAPPPADPPS